MLQNPLSFSDYDDVDHDILGKPDRRPEVSSKSHQKVQDGNDVLGVDRLNTPLVHSTVGPLKPQTNQKFCQKDHFPTVTSCYVFRVRCCITWLIPKTLLAKPRTVLSFVLCPSSDCVTSGTAKCSPVSFSISF